MLVGETVLRPPPPWNHHLVGLGAVKTTSVSGSVFVGDDDEANEWSATNVDDPATLFRSSILQRFKIRHDPEVHAQPNPKMGSCRL